jgi:secretion/DNA translocation related TadE-like protein
MTADSSGPRTRSRSGAAPHSTAPRSADPLGPDPHGAHPHSAADRIRHDDAGVASVWAATAAAVLLLVGTVGVDVAAAVRARHVAAAAADLSALAAAGRSVEGADVACRVAADIAARNGAEVAACRLDGWDALVETRVRWSGLLPIRGPATARARAGPAPLDDGTNAVTPARRRGESDHALGERSAALGERTGNSAARPHHVR